MKCSICGRETPDQYLEYHHLIPASEGGKHKDKIPVCRPCGDQLHQLFTNKELRDTYNTLEKLLANERVWKWIKFVRKRKDFHVCMKSKK